MLLLLPEMLSLQNPCGSLSHFLQVSANMSPAKDCLSGTLPLLSFTSNIFIHCLHIYSLIGCPRMVPATGPLSPRPPSTLFRITSVKANVLYHFSLDLTSPFPALPPFLCSPLQQNLPTGLTQALSVLAKWLSILPVLKPNPGLFSSPSYPAVNPPQSGFRIGKLAPI